MKKIKIILCMTLSFSLIFTALNFNILEKNTPNYVQAKTKYPTKWLSLPTATRTTTHTIKKGTLRQKAEIAVVGLIAGSASLAASKKALNSANLTPILTSVMVTFAGTILINGKMIKTKKLKAKTTYSYRQIKDPKFSPVTGTVSNNFLEYKRTVKVYDGKKLISSKTTYQKVSTISHLVY